MKLKEFCQRLKVSKRTVRYLLEQETIPGIVAVGRGNHRELTGRRAICLACACGLYEAGFRARFIPQFIQLLAKGDPAFVASVRIPLNEGVLVEIDLPFIRRSLEE